MKYNVKFAGSKYVPIALLALMRNVGSKMGLSPTTFATPYVPLATMASKADALEVAIELATDGSRVNKSLRDDLVLEATTMLSSQADYVRGVCAGDRSKLLESGFELAKVPESIGLPGTPVIKVAQMTGKVGFGKISWSRQYGASCYQIWMTDKDPALHASWELTGITTKCSHTVTDLESYKAYWFAVSAIGAAGTGAMSDPALVRAA